MAIQHAINFIKQAGTDDALRMSLYSLEQEEILPTLANAGYPFELAEFEESVNMLHVQCQTEEEADELFDVVNWFKLLYR